MNQINWQAYLIYHPWEETFLENQLAFENKGTNLKASHHGMHGQPETAMM